MLLKKDIFIMDYYSLFSVAEKFKVIYCKELPDYDLFIKYFVQEYNHSFGCCVFVDKQNRKRAFLMNLELPEEKLVALNLFMNNVIQAETLQAII